VKVNLAAWNAPHRLNPICDKEKQGTRKGMPLPYNDT